MTRPRTSRGPLIWRRLIGPAAALALLMGSGCASVDIVRLQPDQLLTPKGTEPVAGIQASCLGFYFFTLGLPYADLERAVNELLMKEAKKLGADRVMNLRFEATPAGGIWFLTKLLFWRSATAWGVAIRTEDGDSKDIGTPLPIPVPPSTTGNK